MDSKPIREVIDAYEKHRLEIRIVDERRRMDRSLKTIKKHIGSIMYLPKTADRAWILSQNLRGLTGVTLEKYPTMEDFFKAVFGYDISEAKDDYDYCNEYRDNHTMSDIQHNEYHRAMNNYLGSMAGKYQMRILKEKWETGRYGKPKPKN